MNLMKRRRAALCRCKLANAGRMLVSVAWGAIALLSVSSEAQTPLPKGMFSFIAHENNPGDVQLTNGHPVASKHWLTLANATMRSVLLPNGTSFVFRCSATLIGPGVLLTAAHCLDPNDGTPLVTRASLKVGDQTLPITCEASPQYADAVKNNRYSMRQPRVNDDYALCEFAVKDSLPAPFNGLKSEVVDTAQPLAAGDAVVMTGYGCKDIRIGVDNQVETSNFDNVLRIGTAHVTQPANPAGDYNDAFILIVSSSSNKPILCPGDSGGPLITSTTANAEPPQPRRIRGVNSTVTIKPDNQGIGSLASVVTPLASDSFRIFLSTWVKEKMGRGICGFNLPTGTPKCAS